MRGYVEEGGWAHAAAHGADALDELVQCRESDAAVQQEVLNALQEILYNGWYSFCDEEDERTATIVDTIIQQDVLPQAAVLEWIGGLALCGSWPKSRSQAITRINTKNFLRSLYFRLIHAERDAVYTDFILSTEAKLNKFAQ